MPAPVDLGSRRARARTPHPPGCRPIRATSALRACGSLLDVGVLARIDVAAAAGEISAAHLRVRGLNRQHRLARKIAGDVRSLVPTRRRGVAAEIHQPMLALAGHVRQHHQPRKGIDPALGITAHLGAAAAAAQRRVDPSASTTRRLEAIPATGAVPYETVAWKAVSIARVNAVTAAALTRSQKASSCQTSPHGRVISVHSRRMLGLSWVCVAWTTIRSGVKAGRGRDRRAQFFDLGAADADQVDREQPHCRLPLPQHRRPQVGRAKHLNQLVVQAQRAGRAQGGVMSTLDKPNRQHTRPLFLLSAVSQISQSPGISSTTTAASSPNGTVRTAAASSIGAASSAA